MKTTDPSSRQRGRPMMEKYIYQTKENLKSGHGSQTGARHRDELVH
jgi:hypothetical protein